MRLSTLQRDAWQVAEDKGHHTNLALIPLREASLVRLALLHTEILELAQAKTPVHRAEELADICIHLGDFAETLHLELPGTLGGPEPAECGERNQQSALLAMQGLVAASAQIIKKNGVDVPSQRTVLLGLLCAILSQVETCAQHWHIDLVAAITAKMAMNRARPFQYGTPGEQQDAG